MFRKILAPLDGSRLAEAILPHVAVLAKCGGAEVVLLRVHVLAAQRYGIADTMLYTAPPDDEERDRRQAAEYLEKAAAPLRAAGIVVTTLVRDGLVADTILDVANTLQADLIAMSTHGRSGIARWLIGSDANKVMHGAKTPVLMIRPAEAEQKAEAVTGERAGHSLGARR